MSRRPRVRDVIDWRLPGPQTRSGRVAQGAWAVAVEAVVTGVLVALDMAGAVSGPNLLSRRRVPADPQKPIRGFTCLVTSGTAPWMPGAHADRPQLHLSATSVWIVPPGLPRRIDLDLSELSLVRLVADHAMNGPADECTATLAALGWECDVHGPWIAIAWLGHLAGWPDPAGV